METLSSLLCLTLPRTGVGIFRPSRLPPFQAVSHVFLQPVALYPASFPTFPPILPMADPAKMDCTGNAPFRLVGRVAKAHGRIIWGGTWAPGSRLFATASRDCTVKLWHVNAEQQGMCVSVSLRRSHPP
jgi:hypothetical protein